MIKHASESTQRIVEGRVACPASLVEVRVEGGLDGVQKQNELHLLRIRILQVLKSDGLINYFGVNTLIEQAKNLLNGHLVLLHIAIIHMNIL